MTYSKLTLARAIKQSMW